MYDDKEYGFNWLGLFVKVIIFVIFILLLVWLVTKIFFKYSDKDLASDISKIQKAAETYFTGDNLPMEIGKSRILTLGEMIDKKLVNSKTIDTCDKEESYAKTTKYQDYYLLKVELNCGNKKNSKTTKLDADGNKTDSSKKDDSKKDTSSSNVSSLGDNNVKDVINKTDSTKGNNKTSTSSSSSNNITSTKTLYYEYAKIKYSRVTQQMANYCKTSNKINTYYTLANDSYNNYVKRQSITYYVTVAGIPDNATNVTVNNIRTFSDFSEFLTYVNERNSNKIMWSEGNNNGGLTYNDALMYQKHSASYGYTPSVYYNKNTKVITISVAINSVNNVPNDGRNIYLPIKFDISYNAVNASSCFVDAYSNRNNYSSYQVTDTWSSTNNIESGLDYGNIKWATTTPNGYKKTGKSEYR